jgi:RNA polymerase sigma factor (sigma-70 family)
MDTAVVFSQDIVDAARTGYPDALDYIYRGFHENIHCYIYRKVQDHELAHDLTQDTFLKAFTSISKTRPDLNLSAWLYTIARNVCLDYWRKNKLHPLDPQTNQELSEVTLLTNRSPCNDPFLSLQQKELHLLLGNILERLNSKQRQALLLIDNEGLSYQEAAQAMSISQAAFTSLLNRARIKFTQLMVSTLSPDIQVQFGYKECLDLLRSFDPVDWPADLHQEITSKARHYFDETAQGFALHRQRRYPSVLDDILLAHCQSLENTVGGDFGSGAGHLSARMAGRFNKVIAIDISPQMVKISQQHFEAKGLRNIELSTGDVNKLCLQGESLDTAYCVNVLHHVLDPAACIKEMSRVIKKGGQLIVSDFEAHKFDVLQREYSDLWMGFEEIQIAKWLKKANFQNVWVNRYHDIGFSLENRSGEISRVPFLVAGGTKV